MRNFKNKIGNFLTIIGFAAILLFFASDFSGSPNYLLLFAGLLGLWLGIKMIRRAYTPPEKANRYRMLRKTFSRNKYYEEEEQDRDTME